LGVPIALFAAAAALLTKVGVSGIDSNLATAIRTRVLVTLGTVILAFASGERNQRGELLRCIEL